MTTIMSKPKIPDANYLTYLTTFPLPLRGSSSKDPLQTYAVLYTLCFPPATKSYLINSRDEPMDFDYAPSHLDSGNPNIKQGCRHRRVRLRSTKSVMVGAKLEIVDDMLELAIRLWAGVDTAVDTRRGAEILKRVYEGPFAPEKKGVAASLIAHFFFHCEHPAMDTPIFGMSPRMRHWVAAIHWAAQSCRLGLFSFICNLIAECALSLPDDKASYEGELRGDLDLVLAQREVFVGETGYQPRMTTICGQCLKTPPEGSRLLQCAGSCARVRRPQYCSRQCQKADWSRHRKWCKKDLDPASDSVDEEALYNMHMVNDDPSKS
ncbi:unnamed protein product [Cyclocybe aegerita]|uniref:MYND-type domain-containing protein n=1 Tax=Cyclocybe aegerita TaxID=1973307 RepID=A0A8S0VUE6_CYCAE|nr:unnamed protein product [Cyclocybe aegerita]